MFYSSIVTQLIIDNFIQIRLVGVFFCSRTGSFIMFRSLSLLLFIRRPFLDYKDYSDVDEKYVIVEGGTA